MRRYLLTARASAESSWMLDCFEWHGAWEADTSRCGTRRAPLSHRVHLNSSTDLVLGRLVRLEFPHLPTLHRTSRIPPTELLVESARLATRQACGSCEKAVGFSTRARMHLASCKLGTLSPCSLILASRSPPVTAALKKTRGPLFAAAPESRWMRKGIECKG